jgi:hypothetical protein
MYAMMAASHVSCTLTFTCVTCCAAQVALTKPTPLSYTQTAYVKTLASTDAVATALSLTGVSSINSNYDEYKQYAAGRTHSKYGILTIVKDKLGRTVTVVRVLPNSELVVPFEYTTECPADRDIVISDRA